MAESKKTVYFNATKKESHTPTGGFKKLFRRLRSSFSLKTNKDEITRDTLDGMDLLVIGDPREAFTEPELEDIRSWLSTGGRILLLVGEDSDRDGINTINHLVESFGMTVNNDSVMRSVFYKYLHPREVFIADGVLVPDLTRKKNIAAANTNRKTSKFESSSTSNNNNSSADQLNFVFPYGSTISVQKPARSLLSSGPISYPMNRPIAAVWESETVSEIGAQRGRIVLMGSVDIFGDEWFDKEENAKLCDVVFAWLLNETELDMTSDRQDTDMGEHNPVPHVEALSQSLKPCLQELDELPKDFTKLFDTSLFRFDTNLIPETVKLYERLGVQHEPLTLIPPQFECPMPKLCPATFPPAMREPPEPALDQFDLDEHFAKEGLRLAQLTNKCTNGEEDLEYFIGEAGEILGIMQDLSYGERSAKHILYHIFCKIVDYKKKDGGVSSSYEDNMNTQMDDYMGMGLGMVDSAMDDTPIVQATAMPVHVAHVDLAPMQGDAGRSHLKALDPNLHIGGPAIGEAKLAPLGAVDSKQIGVKS